MNNTDIDINQNLEYQNKAIKKLLDASEVLDAVSSSYFITDEDLRIVYCNKAFLTSNKVDSDKNVNGLRPGDILQCTNAVNGPRGCGSTLRCKHCNLRKCVVEALKQQEFQNREVTLINAENKMMAIRITATPFVLDNKNFVSISSIDITDSKRKQLMESLFFHDLINLAGSLSGYLDVVGNFEPKEAMEHLPQMRLIAEQVVDEVMAQREISRAEQNRLEADIAELFLPDFLETLYDKINFLPAMAHRKLVFRNPSNDLTIYTDPRLLDRVLLNMLKNALEFIQKGETITLEVKETENDNVLFTVHNPGCIAEENKDYIFHFGFSTKGKGRGLGTYSMRLLGENLLKGKVWFESTPEQGTTFFLRIPKMLMEDLD